MKKIGIIGYGRFGRVLEDLLSKKYQVLQFDNNPIEDENIKFSSLEEILECFLVFIAVPIRSFEEIIKEISKYKLYNTTIVDVCSVKVYPVDIMKKYLPEHVGIIATHLILVQIHTHLLKNLKLVYSQFEIRINDLMN